MYRFAVVIVAALINFNAFGPAVGAEDELQLESKKETPLQIAKQEYKEQLPAEIGSTYGGLLTD